jgi:hypothetical protein
VTAEFLPALPPAFSQATLFGALVVIGLLAGEALRRYASLPRIMGYVLAGAALGPHGLGALTDDLLFDLRLLIDLSIGLIVFELGFRLDYKWLRRNRWLFVDRGRGEPVLLLGDLRHAGAVRLSPHPRRDGGGHRHRDLAGHRACSSCTSCAHRDRSPSGCCSSPR